MCARRLHSSTSSSMPFSASLLPSNARGPHNRAGLESRTASSLLRLVKHHLACAFLFLGLTIHDTLSNEQRTVLGKTVIYDCLVHLLCLFIYLFIHLFVYLFVTFMTLVRMCLGCLDGTPVVGLNLSWCRLVFFLPSS